MVPVVPYGCAPGHLMLKHDTYTFYSSFYSNLPFESSFFAGSFHTRAYPVFVHIPALHTLIEGQQLSGKRWHQTAGMRVYKLCEDDVHGSNVWSAKLSG